MSHRQQRAFCLQMKERFPDYFSDVKVLDVGSLDINGSNRGLFEDCDYTGIDLEEGKNVDVVSCCHEFSSDSEIFDAIISTECFEHDMHVEESLKSIVRMLKKGGLFVFTCASARRPEHGTKRSKPEHSPFTVKREGWDGYYRTLKPEDVEQMIDLNVFSDHQFIVTRRRMDLQFWGIKR